MISENLQKFPSFLKMSFEKYELDFFDGTEWHYNPVAVYRMVLRDKSDYSKVTGEDFLSFSEKPRRGMEDLIKKPDYYGVSFFETKDSLVNKLKLPKPGKKIAEGHLFDCYGPIYRNYPHVCLWVYEGVDFSENDFIVCDYE